jgi:4-amino-4-deoxy-L-arabinose transferase-like glycosyltransferase
MSSGILVKAGPEALRETGRGQPDRPKSTKDNPVEEWLRRRLNLVAAAILAAGFLARLQVAARSFLNPDEALHYIIANQPSAFLAYKASLSNAHPPLIYLLLYFWKILGSSEWVLRFPSVLAGTAVAWAAYKWIEAIFGKAAGVIGLILVAFSPAVIALSAEVRSYAILLFCETSALYFLEVALREKSARKMWYFLIFLYLAIVSHYSALFFVLAAGMYALARIMESELPRKVVVAWASGQAGALAIYAFLYVTHVSKLKNSLTTWAMPYENAYFHADQVDLLTFTRVRTLGIFSFIFENQYLACALLLVWAAAVAFLLVRELVSKREGLSPGHSGLLLLLPFLGVLGAAIAGIYPYFGGRHTMFLAPFVFAALSYALAFLSRQKLWAAMVIAALLSAASNTSGKTFEPFITKENQSRVLMQAAMNHMRETVAPREVILTDYESSLLLAYYFCGPKENFPPYIIDPTASSIKCNGQTIASFRTWNMQPDSFMSNFSSVVKSLGIKPGEKVWVFQAGWGVTLGRNLPLSSAKFRCLVPEDFGANISLIPFQVDPDLAPAPIGTSCPGSTLNSFAK